MAKTFGELFKRLRIESGHTLRQFCLNHGFDPGNISKLERGRLAPPKSREKLQEYARALGVEEGSGDWFEFFDRAAACSGEIPKDILSDEELVGKLPLVFRTLRGEKLSEKQMKELIETIRRS